MRKRRQPPAEIHVAKAGKMAAGVDVGLPGECTSVVVVEKTDDGFRIVEASTHESDIGWSEEKGRTLLAALDAMCEEPRFTLMPGEILMVMRARERLRAAPGEELPIGLYCIAESRTALWRAHGKTKRGA